MPRGRVLSLSPPPPAGATKNSYSNSSGTTAAYTAYSPIPIKKRSSANNHNNKLDCNNDDNANCTIMTTTAADDEQIMTLQLYEAAPQGTNEGDFCGIPYEHDNNTQDEHEKNNEKDDDDHQQQLVVVQILEEEMVDDGGHCCPAQQDDEPDWSAIAKHHPASKDVPIFLEARERRRKLDEQFTESLNGWNETMHAEINSIWNNMADIYQMRSEKINEVEDTIKNLFTSNEITRAEMERKLEASTREVQRLYSSLMMQICQPLGAITAAAMPTLMMLDGGEKSKKKIKK